MVKPDLLIEGAVHLMTFIKEAFKLSLSELYITSRFEDGPSGVPQERLRVGWSTSGTRDNGNRKDDYTRKGWGTINAKGADVTLAALVDKHLRPHELAVLEALPLVTTTISAWVASQAERKHNAPLATIPLDLVAETFFADISKAPALKDQILAAIRQAETA